jgi:hypothetical protein
VEGETVTAGSHEAEAPASALPPAPVRPSKEELEARVREELLLARRREDATFGLGSLPEP